MRRDTIQTNFNIEGVNPMRKDLAAAFLVGMLFSSVMVLASIDRVKAWHNLITESKCVEIMSK